MRNRLIAAGLGLVATAATLLAPTASFAATPCNRVLAKVFDVGTSTTTVNHSFSGWPTTGPGGCAYTSLRLIAQGRDFTDQFNLNHATFVQLGTGGSTVDSGNNYEDVIWTAIPSGGNSVSMIGQHNTDALQVGAFTESGASAGVAGSYDLLFPDAFQTTFHKHVLGSGADGLFGYRYTTSGDWAETGAITVIKVWVDLSISDAFSPHTVFYLYEQ